MNPPPPPAPGPARGSDPRTIGYPGYRPFLLAIALGAVGGFVFHMLKMPLAWMLGSGVFVTIAAVCGLRVGSQKKVRGAMLVILGVLLGSGFTPDVVRRAGEWWISIAFMLACTASIGWIVYLMFRRFAGHDRITAYFGAMPGGLNEMVTLGSALGGNERSISLTQAVRILTVVMTIPVWYRLVAGVQTSVIDQAAEHPPHDWRDFAILIACGVVGWLIASRVKVTAGNMMIPMILSAIVHLAGITDSRPPGEIVAGAQVVIGTAIGARFVGASLREMGNDLLWGFLGTLVSVALAVLFALGAKQVTNLSLDGLVLSYAPGGFAEMSLVALALGVEVAMVAVHHLLRITFIVMGAARFFRRFVDRPD